MVKINEIPTITTRFGLWDTKSIKRIYFKNGYGIDFIGGASGLYGDGINTWEAAEITHDRVIEGEYQFASEAIESFKLTYEHTGGDVMGWLDFQECNKLIEIISSLPNNK